MARKPLHVFRIDHRRYHGRTVSLRVSPELLDWFVATGLPSLASGVFQVAGQRALPGSSKSVQRRR